MAFSGDLESFSLADVFQKVQSNRDTGRLLVDDGKGPFHVFFQEGRVRGVSPAAGPDAFLTGVLSRRGGLDETALRKAEKRAKDGGVVSGAVRAGLLTEDGAKDLLAFYCSERLFDLLALDKGKFAFEEGAEPLERLDADQKAFGVDLDPGKILFEGARRADEWKRIKKRIISAGEIFVPNEKKKDAASPEDQDEAAVLALLDGRRAVSDVTAVYPGSRFAVCRAMAALLDRSLVRPLTSVDATSATRRLLAEGQVEEALRVGRKGLETERNNPELRKLIADVLVKKGEKEKAAGELKLLAYSFAEDGNFSAAEKIYREAVDLDPRDFDARERLFNLVAERRSLPEVFREGQDFASAAKKFGALDKARDILGRLTSLSPGSPAVLEALADIHERVGNRDEAVRILRQVSQIHFEAELYPQAQAVLERVLFLRPGDVEAEKRLQEIKTGRAMRRRRLRKILVRLAIAASVFAVGLAWVVYDWISHMELARLSAELVCLSAEAKHLEGAEACRRFEEGHPLTAAAWRARTLRLEFETMHLLRNAAGAEAKGELAEALKLAKDALALASEKLPEGSSTLRIARETVTRLEEKLGKTPGKSAEETPKGASEAPAKKVEDARVFTRASHLGAALMIPAEFKQVSAGADSVVYQSPAGEAMIFLERIALPEASGIEEYYTREFERRREETCKRRKDVNAYRILQKSAITVGGKSALQIEQEFCAGAGTQRAHNLVVLVEIGDSRMLAVNWEVPDIDGMAWLKAYDRFFKGSRESLTIP